MRAWETFWTRYFPKCFEKATGEESGGDSDAEGDENIAVTAVLEVGEIIDFRDYCTLIIAAADEIEESKVIVGGSDHHLISVNMVLAGGSRSTAGY